MANTVKIDKVCPNVFGISVRRYQQLAKESILPQSDNGYIDFVLATKHLISYYQKLVEGQGSIVNADLEFPSFCRSIFPTL
jgi:hypothetical protein